MRRLWRIVIQFALGAVFLYYFRQPSDLRNLRVAVIDQTDKHAEVLSAAVSHLQYVGIGAKVYSDHTPRGLPSLRPVSLAASAVKAGEFDAIVLTSCDSHYWDSHPLIRALANSRAKVVCIVHEPDTWGKKDAAFLSPLIDNTRFVTLSAHVAHTLNTTLDRLEVKAKAPVEHIAPVYTPTAHLLDRTKRGVRRAGIVGRVRGQRDYDELGRALVEAMRADPETWGYELVGNALSPVAGAEPFELHVIGYSDVTLELPAELDGIVKQHSPRGSEFYRRIHEMDVVLPLLNNRYLTSQATMSIPTAIMAKTPVLVSPAALKAYTYLAPPGVLPTTTDEPASLVAALASLRRSPPPPQKGKAWDKYHAALAKENTAVWRRLLQ